MAYVIPQRFDRVLDFPAALPQTELRRGNTIKVSTIVLKAGQRLEVRCLTLQLASIITPAITPAFLTDATGLVVAGVYNSPCSASSATLISLGVPGVVSLNPNQSRGFESPGTYDVLVTNNTINADLSVVLTGVLKVYT